MLLQQTAIFTASIAIANPRAAIYIRRHANFMSDLQTILIRCRTAVQQCLLICVSANPIHALCGAKITRRHIVPASTLPEQITFNRARRSCHGRSSSGPRSHER